MLRCFDSSSGPVRGRRDGLRLPCDSLHASNQMRRHQGQRCNFALATQIHIWLGRTLNPIQAAGSFVVHLPEGPSSLPTSRARASSARMSLPHAAAEVNDSPCCRDLQRVHDFNDSCRSMPQHCGDHTHQAAIWGAAASHVREDKYLWSLLACAALAAICALRVSSRACHAASSPSAAELLPLCVSASPLALGCEGLVGAKSMSPWRSAFQLHRRFSTFLTTSAIQCDHQTRDL